MSTPSPVPALFPSTDPAEASVHLQQRRHVANLARQLERKLGTIRRAKVKLRKLEDEARSLKREVTLWMTAEVPDDASNVVGPDRDGGAHL